MRLTKSHLFAQFLAISSCYFISLLPGATGDGDFGLRNVWSVPFQCEKIVVVTWLKSVGICFNPLSSFRLRITRFDLDRGTQDETVDIRLFPNLVSISTNPIDSYFVFLDETKKQLKVIARTGGAFSCATIDDQLRLTNPSTTEFMLPATITKALYLSHTTGWYIFAQTVDSLGYIIKTTDTLTQLWNRTLTNMVEIHSITMNPSGNQLIAPYMPSNNYHTDIILLLKPANGGMWTATFKQSQTCMYQQESMESTTFENSGALNYFCQSLDTNNPHLALTSVKSSGSARSDTIVRFRLQQMAISELGSSVGFLGTRMPTDPRANPLLTFGLFNFTDTFLFPLTKAESITPLDLRYSLQRDSLYLFALMLESGTTIDNHTIDSTGLYVMELGLPISPTQSYSYSSQTTGFGKATPTTLQDKPKTADSTVSRGSGIIWVSILVPTCVMVTIALILYGRRSKEDKKPSDANSIISTVSSRWDQNCTTTHMTNVLAVPGYLEIQAKSAVKTLRLIAEGGGGHIYHVELIADELKQRSGGSRHGVLKVSKVSVPPTPRQKDIFYQEVSLMAYLSQKYPDSFARLLGYDPVEISLVMDHYMLGSLKQYLNTKNSRNTDRKPVGSSKLSRCQLVHISVGVARALLAMHQEGLVHCDLKSDNILLREQHVKNNTVKNRHVQLCPVLADLGISRILNPEQLLVHKVPRANVRGCSINYASPEILRSYQVVIKGGGVADSEHLSSDLDLKCCDVYSFGCVLYELMTGGRAPWGK